MKCTLVVIAASLFTLMGTSVFAGNDGTNPRLARCINSAVAEGFNCKTYVGCVERKSYVASCMNGNEAVVHYASINRALAPATANTAVAADFDRLLNEAPTAAGNE